MFSASLFFVVFCLTFSVFAQECGSILTWPSGNSYGFDLSPLMRYPTEPHVASGTNDTYYYINFCQVTDSGCYGDSVVCEQAQVYNHFSCGSLRTTRFLVPSEKFIAEGQGISIKYTDGDICPSGLNRQSIVTVVCDPSIFGPELVWIYVSETNGTYSFIAKHASGCGTFVPEGDSSSLISGSSGFPVSHGSIIFDVKKVLLLVAFSFSLLFLLF